MNHFQQVLTGMGAGVLQQVKWLAEAERVKRKEILEPEEIYVYVIFLPYFKTYLWYYEYHFAYLS